MPAARWQPAERAGLIVTLAPSTNHFPPGTGTTMDTSTLLFAILTATLAGVTFHAWRLGNEKRDVALLGVFSGLCGVGTAVAAIL